MFNPDDMAMEIDLRAGLRELPEPVTRPDFDARILSAVLQKPSRLQRVWLVVQRLHPMPCFSDFWLVARPVLSGAFCSLALILALVHWTLGRPVSQESTPVGSAFTQGLAESRIEASDAQTASLLRLTRFRLPMARRTTPEPTRRTHLSSS